MSLCTLSLFNYKFFSWSRPLNNLGQIISKGVTNVRLSLRHKRNTFGISKHWPFPNETLYKFHLLYKPNAATLIELEFKKKNFNQFKSAPSESSGLNYFRLSSTPFFRMSELPLKSITLNSSIKGIDIPQVELSRLTNGKSPMKYSLKRKSSSLEHCHYEEVKENCSSSDSSLHGKSPNKRKKHSFTVSIEGNIGSGKSTFLKYFSKNSNVATYQEPIEQWTNLGGHNLLGKLYEDPDRWNFLFQSFVQLTRLKIHLDQPNVKSKLIERSFHNNRFCFLEHAHDSGNLNDSEFNVLTEYYDFFDQQLNIGIDLIVYLRTSPEVVFERMKKRGRSEELSVSLDYLKGIHKYYERWLMDSIPRKPPAPVLVINGDLDLDTLLKEYEKHLPVIIGEKKYENGQSTKAVISLLETPAHES